MLNVDEYKKNPCKVSSIPYWKVRAYKIPNNTLVIHDNEYKNNHTNLENNGVDTLYFRLIHYLKNIEINPMHSRFMYRSIDFTSIRDFEDIVDIINKCYSHIQVNLEQVISWTRQEVFQEDLWIFIIDKDINKPVGLGIAEYDKEVSEGMLEWIQVLPEYRGQKLGQSIVKKLLLNLSEYADFATVSGEVNNKSNPEILYRKCGFVGNDIWHVIVN